MSCKYISHNYPHLNSAGNKAKSDMELIMESEGFENIGLSRSFVSNKIGHFVLNLAGIIKASMSLKKGDILILQYPLKKYFSFICKRAHKRGAKTVALIHDLGAYRRKALSPEKEFERLRNADYIIATNPVMAEKLRESGIDRPMGSLGIWDYLTPTKPGPHTYNPENVRIAYAGGISRRKNSFIWSWGRVIQNYKVDIYGSGLKDELELENSDAFGNYGFFRPEEFIKFVHSDFGLVWDGDSLESCEGDFGSYLRINTPHKTSMYIRAGLPVIVWSKSAMAGFVKENGIGLCIDRLEDINNIATSVTREEYDRMRSNVAKVAYDLARGAYFKRAVSEAIKAMLEQGTGYCSNFERLEQ